MARPPPLPSAQPPAAPPLPGPPRSKASGCLIALAVSGALCIPLIGILAAIAIPAYQDYVVRSRVSAALIAARGLQERLDSELAQTGECRDARREPTPGVADIEVGWMPDGRCGYTLRLDTPTMARLNGRTIGMNRSRDSTDWRCHGSVQARHLPMTCRKSTQPADSALR